MTTPSWKRTALWLLLIVALLSHTRLVSANGPAPPDIWWFSFAGPRDGGPWPTLEGLQVIGCEAERCEHPVLLKQSGECRDAACLSSEFARGELALGAQELNCAEERCRFTNFYRYRDQDLYGHYFKLVAQFPDGARASSVLHVPTDRDYGNEAAWVVDVQAETLVLSPDTAWEGSSRTRLRRAIRGGYGPSGFLFTQFVEIPVAVVCLCLWLKSPQIACDKKSAWALALKVFLINLVTFPIVWIFFPSLGRLQPVPARAAGIAVLVLALLYGVLLVLLYSVTPERKKAAGISTAVVVPLTFLCALVLWGYVAYSARASVAEMGLPAQVIVPIAEAFAVVAETVLLAVLHKRTLSFWKAGLTSLLMNAASFLLGLLVLGIWP